MPDAFFFSRTPIDPVFRPGPSDPVPENASRPWSPWVIAQFEPPPRVWVRVVVPAGVTRATVFVAPVLSASHELM